MFFKTKQAIQVEVIFSFYLPSYFVTFSFCTLLQQIAQSSFMAQRKVLIKYFPKNFDPKLLVKRGRGKDKLMNVRNMLPMSLRCNTCANYLYIGTKFNMRMEICNEETYLGIKVFRFYLKCTYCYNEICFKTDPKNHDYIVEDGGTRNYEPIKDAEQAQKLMKKMRKDQKEGNSMKFLQTKTYDSKREMQLMQALDDIKNLNKRQALIDPEDLLNNMFVQQQQDQKFTQEQERQIDAHFDQLRKKKLQQLYQINSNTHIKQTHEESNGIKNEDCLDIKQQEGASNVLPEKAEEQFNARIHAIIKGNLFQQKKKQKGVKNQSHLGKFKIIKKEKQKQKVPEEELEN